MAPDEPPLELDELPLELLAPLEPPPLALAPLEPLELLAPLEPPPLAPDEPRLA